MKAFVSKNKGMTFTIRFPVESDLEQKLRLLEIINSVYQIGEGDLFVGGLTRTNEEALTKVIVIDMCDICHNLPCE